MTELPDDIQRIITTEKARPRRTSWPHARHIIEFTCDADPGDITVARFAADGPLPIPAVGDEVSVHRTVVSVVRVWISYQADEDGAPVLYAAVRIAPAD